MITCNIDARGKAVRLILGAGVVLIGLILIVLAWLEVWAGLWVWGLAAGLLTAGGFMIFEAWAGWCVLRAMGVRTSI